jgi:2-keto-4-pentenoate hydratase/2-oxohepta-3-ene-1,7-dioic acid hydratase in catechol pathway
MGWYLTEMKLLRVGPKGHEKPALLDETGQVRDLSPFISDLTANSLSPERLREIAALPRDRMPVIRDVGRIGTPYSGVRKFLAIGLNYRDHAVESNLPIPTEPVVFMKATSCINGPNDDVMLPQGSVKTDWEVELGIVIGTTARYVPEEKALEYVAGYCVVHDVSEREFQIERGGTWDKGKGCDTFGPFGPYLVTRDEIPDPQNLDMSLSVNGQRKQSGNTRTMIFGVAHLVSYLSRFLTLEPGDLITTGTPPGVGMGQKPTPQYLKAGDVVELSIAGLGVQKQRIVGFQPISD